MTKNIFLNIDKQINHLKENKLNIDKIDIFKWYISNFNYKNIISGYNLFFKINNDKKSTFYKQNINSSMIIELFNIDRMISKVVLSDILSIERKLSTLISYVLMENLTKMRDSTKFVDGLILNWLDDDILLIFPNLKRVDVKTRKISKNIDLKKNIKDFRNFLLPKKLKTNNNITHPIWVLCLYWTLGETIFVFKMLRADYRFKILKEFFRNKKIKIKKNEISFFEEIFIILNIIRNICCHNNVLYDFSYKTIHFNHFNKIMSFINKMLGKNFKSVKLFTVLEIIVCFSPHKTNLIKICEEKFEETKELSCDVKELIKNYISGK